MEIKDYILYGALSLSLLLGIVTTINTRYHQHSIKKNEDLIMYLAEESNKAKGDISANRFIAARADSSVDLISKKIKNLQERTREMIGGPVEGVPGSSKVEGLDKVFEENGERRESVRDEPESAIAGRVGDLFPGPGPDGFDVLYGKMLGDLERSLQNLTVKDYFSRGAAAEVEEARESMRVAISYLKSIKKAVDRERKEDSAYEHIQESLKRSWEYLRQINENVKEGRKAVREANDLLRSQSKGGLDLPDVPVLPDMPVIPKDMLETDDAVLKYRQMLQDYQRVIQYFARLRHHAKEGMEALEEGLQNLREGKVPTVPDYQPLFPKEEEAPPKKEDPSEEKKN